MPHAFDRTLEQALSRRFSRRGLLKGTVATGAGAVALTLFGGNFGGNLVMPRAAEAAAAPLVANDVDALNYALTLELLEAAAYKAVNDMNVLTGRAKTYFQAFGAHEQAHVDALMATFKSLGATPQPLLPSGGMYNFSALPQDQAGIVKFFQGIEAVGISAYLGAAPLIQNLDILDAALAIHAVEAEHTSALADLVAPGTDLFAPAAFEMGRTPEEVVALVTPFFQAAAPMPGLPNTGGGFAAAGGDGVPNLVVR